MYQIGIPTVCNMCLEDFHFPASMIKDSGQISGSSSPTCKWPSIKHIAGR